MVVGCLARSGVGAGGGVGQRRRVGFGGSSEELAES